MLTSSICKHHSHLCELEIAIQSCNAVFEQDFGPGHVIDAKTAPDIILMTKDENGKINGVVGLHHHEDTCAWELGTVSASVPRTHSTIMRLLIEKEAPIAIRRWYGEDDAWLVKRLKQKHRSLQASMNAIGFKLPDHFMVGILEDCGYIPFDPTDEVLMKKKIVFDLDC